MTSYNGANYISQQLESISKQTIQDYELIICDDCSKDNTVEIIKAFQKIDSRIKLFCNEVNLGFKKTLKKLSSSARENTLPSAIRMMFGQKIILKHFILTSATIMLLQATMNL